MVRVLASAIGYGRWTPLAFLATCALGCGPQNDDQLHKDLSSLHEELANQRRAQEKLLQRLDRLEARVQLSESAPKAKSPVIPPVSDPLAALPVVKLAPATAASKAVTAPPLDTRIAVREPSDEELAELDKGPAVNGDAVLEKHDEELDRQFAASVRRYNAGERKAAGEELAAFASAHPRHEAADNALYLAGMALVVEGRCQDGAKFFQAVVRDYDEGDAVGPSLLALGHCEAGLGRADKAKGYFEQVLKESPRSAEASQAEAALAELSGRKPVAGRP